MRQGLKVLPGDRASDNPVRAILPRGATSLEIRGPEFLPEIMRLLGPLKDDPDDLVLSKAGAEQTVLDLARNHLEMALTKPMKNGWVLVRRQLDEIEQAAGTLSQALATTCGLTAHALLRTGSQLHTQRFLQQLNSLIQDVSRALELVPENNMGDAVAALVQVGTANERLVLGCQNLLYACGHTAVGAKAGGLLEEFSALVKALALGPDCLGGGLPSGAMRSAKLKGRSRSNNLKLEALFLITGDAHRRRGPESELVRRAQKELEKWAG